MNTPGTTLTWSTAAEWMAVDRELGARRISAKWYRDRNAHLEALVGAGDWFLQQSIEELRDLALYMRGTHKPLRGTPGRARYGRIIDQINNAIAAHERFQASLIREAEK